MRLIFVVEKTAADVALAQNSKRSRRGAPTPSQSSLFCSAQSLPRDPPPEDSTTMPEPTLPSLAWPTASTTVRDIPFAVSWLVDKGVHGYEAEDELLVFMSNTIGEARTVAVAPPPHDSNDALPLRGLAPFERVPRIVGSPGVIFDHGEEYRYKTWSYTPAYRGRRTRTTSRPTIRSVLFPPPRLLFNTTPPHVANILAQALQEELEEFL
ncbi:hypothetical protein EDB85DRAFT_2158551 [Lactarius pseudohatsudake]|nr:hypothetical protein EDB85DRAFT_2158551 [Lactarius pseudohatsudake]